jgi:tetratricopeptide (TPR) repeat protein
VTLIIFRKELFFFPVAFALWALFLVARYGDHRYFDLPPPSAGLEQMRSSMNNAALLRNSIAELQRNLVQEKKTAEIPHILQNIGCGYYDLYKETGDRQLLDSALIFINQSVVANPLIARFHYNFGRLYTELGDQEKAMRQYEATLQCDPRHILALSNAGTCSYFAFGDRVASANYFNRALAVDSLMPMCHLVLGLICIDNKNYSDALAYFEKELGDDEPALVNKRYPLSPANIRYAASLAHENLMTLYSTQFKDRAKAKEHLDGYMKYEPEESKRVQAAKAMRRYWGGK